MTRQLVSTGHCKMTFIIPNIQTQPVTSSYYTNAIFSIHYSVFFVLSTLVLCCLLDKNVLLVSILIKCL